MSELKHSMLAPTPLRYFNCPMAVDVDEMHTSEDGSVSFIEFKTAAMQGIIAHQMAELELIYGSAYSHSFNTKAPSSSKRFGRRG